MTRGILVLASVMLFSGAQATAQSSDAGEPFEVSNVFFEQNASDGDVEVVFDLAAGDAGLSMLTVTSPDGRPVVDFKARDLTTLGIRKFKLESPEPADVEALKAAYPEGTYTFAATSVSGEHFNGKDTLSHTLPETSSYLRPADGAEGVLIRDLVLSWKPVANLASYMVEIEQEELGVDLVVSLPSSTTSFAVPNEFLMSDTEYILSIGTVTEDGNISVVESTFTTAKGN